MLHWGTCVKEGTTSSVKLLKNSLALAQPASASSAFASKSLLYIGFTTTLQKNGNEFIALPTIL